MLFFSTFADFAKKPRFYIVCYTMGTKLARLRRKTDDTEAWAVLPNEIFEQILSELSIQSVVMLGTIDGMSPTLSKSSWPTDKGKNKITNAG